MPNTDNRSANIGVVGLAVMGSNLARNLASREGNTVAVYNRSPGHRGAHRRAPRGRLPAAETIDDFVATLAKPRTAIIMVQAGKGTDAVIEQLAERFEPGDIIVDGGNANFKDTIRRERDAARAGPELRRHRASPAARRVRSTAPRSCPAVGRGLETLGPILGSSPRWPRASRASPMSAPTARATSSRWSTTASSTPTCS